VTFVDETQGVVDNFDDYGTDSEGQSPPKARRAESSLTIDAVIHPENESPVSHSPSHMHLTSGRIPQSRPDSSLVRAASPVRSLPQHGMPTSRSQGLAQTAIQYGPHLPSPDLSTTKVFAEQDVRSISLYPETPSTFQDSSPSTFPSIYLDEPVWPLTDPAEANLLRHFVQNLAIWVSQFMPLIPFFSLISHPSLISVIPNSISKLKFPAALEPALSYSTPSSPYPPDI
jgi:hypothetical protein